MAHFNVDIVHYHPQFAEATVKCGEIVKKKRLDKRKCTVLTVMFIFKSYIVSTL